MRPKGPQGSSWELGLFHTGGTGWRRGLSQRQMARVQQQAGAPGSCLVPETGSRRTLFGSLEMWLESCPPARRRVGGVSPENLEH